MSEREERLEKALRDILAIVNEGDLEVPAEEALEQIGDLAEAALE